LILGKLGVHEIEAIERMLRVLDAAVHVNPAPSASIALNGRVGIHDLELVGVVGHAQLVPRHRRQAVVGLEPQLLQPITDRRHLAGRRAGLDLMDAIATDVAKASGVLRA
jgi:hypothetical protein